MTLSPADRLAVFLGLAPAAMLDFEDSDAPPAPGDIAARTGLDARTVHTLWTDPVALAAFRLDPNGATPSQIVRLPDLEAESAGRIEDARPFFALTELEAASGVPLTTLREIFHDPLFDLPGTLLADQSLVSDPLAGLAIVGDPLPDPARLEALGFTVERRAGTPPRLILRMDTPPSAAAINTAKGLAGGRLMPAMRDHDGISRLYLPGYADVWFTPGTSRATAETALAAAGLVLTRWVEGGPLAEARLLDAPPLRDAHGALVSALRAIGGHESVVLAEPKQIQRAPEPAFEDRGAGDFLSVGTGDIHWPDAAIRLDEAHAISRGSSDVTVFVIDSGAALDHPDIAPALRADWRDHDLAFGHVPDDRSPAAQGIDHGTAVAGLAVGRAPSRSAGVTGVAPRAALVPIRIEGHGRDYAERALAIRQAVALTAPDGRAVINLSWQTEGSHEGIYLALRIATQAGLVVTTSAGNYRSDDERIADKPHYPSAYGLPAPVDAAGRATFETLRGLVSVAALDASGGRATYSYFGNGAVTLAAPGGEAGGPGRSIWVTMANTAYGFAQGTSYAAPLVAGAVALLLGARPDLDGPAAVDLLRRTARPLPADQGMGAGAIDVAAALSADAAAPEPTPLPCACQPAPADTLPARTSTDINTAPAEALAALPMLGRWNADRIVERRQSVGPYPDTETLRRLLGLDAWAWSRLSPHVRV